MTKNIIFIFAALCSLQARADVQPTEKDTVRCMFRYDDTELLQPLQPSYLDGVVVPARGNGNWFVSIAGGHDSLSRHAARLRRPVREVETLVQYRCRKVVHALGRRTYKLQRVAVQGRHAGRAGVPLSPCGFAVECAWRRLCQTGTGTMDGHSLCRYRAAASCDQRA